MTSYNLTLSIWVPIAVSILHLVGIGAAIHALYYSRSSQGSITWILSLMLFPILTLPIYFIFGKTRFGGYRERIGAMLATHRELYAKYRELLVTHRTGAIADRTPDALESIAGNDILSGNKLELLINGTHTFEKIFEAIDRAAHYILIEFFIIKDDELGMALQERLIRKAKEGVAVYLLFDEVGSKKLSSETLSRALPA